MTKLQRVQRWEPFFETQCTYTCVPLSPSSIIWHQILSESSRLCWRYGKNVFVFFQFTVKMGWTEQTVVHCRLGLRSIIHSRENRRQIQISWVIEQHSKCAITRTQSVHAVCSHSTHLASVNWHCQSALLPACVHWMTSSLIAASILLLLVLGDMWWEEGSSVTRRSSYGGSLPHKRPHCSRVSPRAARSCPVSYRQWWAETNFSHLNFYFN